MKRKLIAVLLTACMVCSMAACGNATNQDEKTSQSTVGSQTVESTVGSSEETQKAKEPVTITYYYTNNAGEQQYTKQVEEKLNEIMHGIEGYEHISIDLVPCSTSYKTDFTLAQANGDQIDLISTFGLDFSTMVKDGDVLALDDLLAAYPGVASDIPAWMLDYGKVNGTQYYIPTYQQACKLGFMYAPVEYFDMYYKATGNDRDDISKILQEGTVEEKLDMYEDFALAVREDTGLNTKYMRQLQYPMHWYNLDDIEKDNGRLFLKEGDTTPTYWPLSDDFKTIFSRMNEWYKEGLIAAPNTTSVNNDFTNDTSLVFDLATNACSEENFAASRSTDDITMDAIRLTSHAFIPSKWAAGGNAIYADCEHPEEAMMIIELLMSEKENEFFNTFVWGLEGIHYEWVDKSVPRIKTLEFDGTQGDASTTYCAMGWNTGNTFNNWLNQSSASDDFFRYIDEEIHNGADTVTSPAMGITWDLSSVADQLAQCNAVNTEYFATLYAAEDFEATYKEYVEKLKAAGVQDLIDVATKQLNDYLGK